MVFPIPQKIPILPMYTMEVTLFWEALLQSEQGKSSSMLTALRVKMDPSQQGDLSQ